MRGLAALLLQLLPPRPALPEFLAAQHGNPRPQHGFSWAALPLWRQQAAAAALRLLFLHLLAARAAGVDETHPASLGICSPCPAQAAAPWWMAQLTPLGGALRERLLALVAAPAPQAEGAVEGAVGGAVEGAVTLGEGLRAEAAAALLAGARLFWPSGVERSQLGLALSRAAKEGHPTPALAAWHGALFRLFASAPLASNLVLQPELDASPPASSMGQLAFLEVAAACGEMPEVVELRGAPTSALLAAIPPDSPLSAAAAKAASAPHPALLGALLSATLAHTTAVCRGAPPPPGGEGAVHLLSSVCAELLVRASFEGPPPLQGGHAGASLLEAINVLLPAATTVLEAGQQPGSPPLAEALGRTYVLRLLPYLLEALYQLSPHPRRWAHLLLSQLQPLAASLGRLSLGGGPARLASSLASSTSGEASEADCGPRSEELLESSHPLATDPPSLRRTVHLPGASHLSLIFDGRCASHASDVLTVTLPAPPLASGWNLEAEVTSFQGPPATPQLERQARRAEFEGHSSQAHGLVMNLYA